MPKAKLRKLSDEVDRLETKLRLVKLEFWDVYAHSTGKQRAALLKKKR